jgi:hypothetical protein
MYPSIARCCLLAFIGIRARTTRVDEDRMRNRRSDSPPCKCRTRLIAHRSPDTFFDLCVRLGRCAASFCRDVFLNFPFFPFFLLFSAMKRRTRDAFFRQTEGNIVRLAVSPKRQRRCRPVEDVRGDTCTSRTDVEPSIRRRRLSSRASVVITSDDGHGYRRQNGRFVDHAARQHGVGDRVFRLQSEQVGGETDCTPSRLDARLFGVATTCARFDAFLLLNVCVASVSCTSVDCIRQTCSRQ